MPYLKIDGKKFHYAGDPEGEGLPIIFCHGSGGTNRHWAFQLRGLKNEINPIAVDLPGHGLSEGETSTNIADYRDWIHYFAGAFDLAPFVLAGHSMGGAVALDYALQYPGELAGLVLVSTGARLRVAPAITDTLRAGKVPRGMTSFAYGPKSSSKLLESAQREQESTPPEVYLADFTACNNFDIMKELPRINLPSLIICGTADRLTPIKYSLYLKEHLSQGELVEVEEAGHMVMLEAPEQVNGEIINFVERLSNS